MNRCHRIWLLGVKNKPSTKGAKSSKKKIARKFRPVCTMNRCSFVLRARD